MSRTHESDTLLSIITTYIEERRRATKIIPTRKSAVTGEPSGAGSDSNALIYLITALCTAENGTAEWYELEGNIAYQLQDDLVRQISILVAQEAGNYTATVQLLLDQKLDRESKLQLES